MVVLSFQVVYTNFIGKTLFSPNRENKILLPDESFIDINKISMPRKTFNSLDEAEKYCNEIVDKDSRIQCLILDDSKNEKVKFINNKENIDELTKEYYIKLGENKSKIKKLLKRMFKKFCK